ncbi:MAG: CoB--CoM heterodisulfide reductase iron-sulfur subunit B family protein [Deltaproteobacteria bacterium]|nr:CoB--CoM heterodisulfide reductase iron-sulfur subunit B family protein [Deltaproteobacteria bacterium]MBW2019418.1 CoB--CoM heterodisulfide reductase iron-sulfur subunit B family protein [Deltaproteobacteria bacterium]MBW2074255.1 CoB--CoM heterodisulfide reductase iron-sulfur subunit B family protein [Deltaproteobacteria bacterium]RLB83934.1 MAG: disulfide reductase [Deltaproteobacteria bacterium]
MKVSYYPGCSLEASARDYQESIEGVCRRLEMELAELEDWNCCGATAAHSLNHRASIELPARNLVIAEKAGNDLVVPCPMCFNRLKVAEKALLNEETGRYRYTIEGKTKIWDLADFMAQDKVLDLIESKVTNPIKGIKAVCYYGCMSSRPPKITDVENYENPVSMDKILKRLGAEPIDWAYKTDCCGASHVVDRPDMVFKMVGKLYERALDVGANCIVVSCQMCQANLDIYQDKIGKQMGMTVDLPIIYFTELIGLAMKEREVESWLARHFVDPLTFLSKQNLLPRLWG